MRTMGVVSLSRKKTKLGKSLPMDVFINGGRHCSIFEGQTKDLPIPPKGGVIQVRLNGFFQSNEIAVQSAERKSFCCDVPTWVKLDFLELRKTKKLRRKALVIKEVAK